MIYRVERKDNPYVMVDKGFISDTNLGYKEKGILLYFLSKPDGWKFYEEEITSHSHDGITSVRAGIQVLIKAGYIERRQLKSEHGKFAGYEYIVHETSYLCNPPDTKKPFSENPITENPKTDKPISENLTLLNNKKSNNESNNIDLSNIDGNKDVTAPIKKNAGSVMERFEDFYQAYPKHKSKGDAEKAWKSLNPNESLVETILASLETAKKSYDWTKQNGKYVPYPATWIRAKGWKDEITENKKGEDQNDGCSACTTDSKQNGKFADSDFGGVSTF